MTPKPHTESGVLSAEIYALAAAKNLTLSELHEDPGRLDDMFRELTSGNKA